VVVVVGSAKAKAKAEEKQEDGSPVPKETHQTNQYPTQTNSHDARKTSMTSAWHYVDHQAKKKVYFLNRYEIDTQQINSTEILIKCCEHLGYAICTLVTLYVSEIYSGLDQMTVATYQNFEVHEKDLVSVAGEVSCAEVADLTYPLPPDYPTPSDYRAKAAMWVVGHDSISLNDNQLLFFNGL